MFSKDESTTLICLFHHVNQADAALRDLDRSGVPASAITVIDGAEAQEGGSSQLASLGVPSRDLEHLERGVEAGGVVIAVAAISDHVSAVERIFGEHRAKKIDEVESGDERDGLAAAALPQAGAAIPIVEEELVVGKRTVDQGGVRVYQRVVEMPAAESVILREEHVVVERNAVDRPATASDLEAQGGRAIELKETAEEAVVGKTARVVEEILIGKQTSEHTEHIQDTVRRTEVELEQLPAIDTSKSTQRPL